MKPFEYKTIVRFSDTDLYGVVHHSNYFKWLEEARIQLLEEIIGLDVAWMEKESLRFPVIKVEGKYKKSVFARERITVNTYLYYDGTAKLTFQYEVLDEDEKVCFAGKTEHAVLHGDRMLLRMPDDFDRRIREKIKEYGEGYIIVC